MCVWMFPHFQTGLSDGRVQRRLIGRARLPINTPNLDWLPNVLQGVQFPPGGAPPLRLGTTHDILGMTYNQTIPSARLPLHDPPPHQLITALMETSFPPSWTLSILLQWQPRQQEIDHRPNLIHSPRTATRLDLDGEGLINQPCRAPIFSFNIEEDVFTGTAIGELLRGATSSSPLIATLRWTSVTCHPSL